MMTPESQSGKIELHLPAPTAWPGGLAFGLMLVFAGLVTTGAVSMLGGVLGLAGCVGWFRDVLPHEQHEMVTVAEELAPAVSTRTEVSHVPIAEDMPRAFLPLETYPISAGIKGGLAGAVAMAVVASLYGLIAY